MLAKTHTKADLAFDIGAWFRPRERGDLLYNALKDLLLGFRIVVGSFDLQIIQMCYS